MSNNITEYESNGFTFSLLENDAITKHLQKGQLWEPHLLRFMREYLQENSNCLDIGSFFGWHSLEMSRLCPNGRIYAFEPRKESFELLIRNTCNNNITNVTGFNMALGNTNNKQCLYDNSTESSFKNFGDCFLRLSVNPDKEFEKETYIWKGSMNIKVKKEMVYCRKLDTLDLKNKIDFIKMDVQGMELEVLKGGEKSIFELNRPVIDIELEDECLTWYNITSKDIIDYIKSHRYEIFLLDFEYPADHICVPEEKLNIFREKFEDRIQPLTTNNNINNNLFLGIKEK